MKYLWTAILILLVGPFLICDPQEGVLYYRLFIDAVQAAGDFPAEADGSARIDLSALPITDGPHEYTLSAENIWGWSDQSTPLLDTKSLPTIPVGVDLSF